MSGLAPLRPPRRAGPGLVPMVNLAFLLLVMILVMSRLAPEAAARVELARVSGATPAPATEALTLTDDGMIAFGAERGEAAIDAALRVAGSGDMVLVLRPDARADGARLAQVLQRLSEGGAGRIALSVTAENAE